MEHSKLTIGVIGNRRDFSYDLNSESRKLLRQKLHDVLLRYSNEFVITGIGGLNLGLEQDFLYSCNRLHIPYKIIIPYKQSICHVKHPTIDNFVNFLIDHAKEVENLSNQKFSLKKNFEKKEFILKNCDVIITNNTKITLLNEESTIIYV